MGHKVIVLWHKTVHFAHRAEHPVHLTYFGGLSTGLIDYHIVAVGCLLVGIITWLCHE